LKLNSYALLLKPCSRRNYLSEGRILGADLHRRFDFNSDHLGRLLIDWSVHDFLRFFIGMVADHGSPTHLACGLRMTGRRAGIALVSPRCRLARVRALSRSRCRPHFTEVIVGKIFLAVGIVTLCDHVLSVGHSDYSGGGPRGNILFRAGRLGTLTGVIEAVSHKKCLRSTKWQQRAGRSCHSCYRTENEPMRFE
jgi:hypothetical protein